jgi:hypothetical protein
MGIRMIRAMALAAVALSFDPGAAWAQANMQILRGQTQQIQRAIQNQVQQALRPTLIVRGLVPGGIPRLAASPSGRWLLVSAGDGSLRVWTLARGREDRRIAGTTPHPHLATLSATGDTLVTVGADGGLRIVRLASNETVRTIAAGAVPTALALSNDGQSIAAALPDGGLRVWDVASGRQTMAVPRAHQGPASAIVFGDARTLASAGTDGPMRLWNTANGSRVREFTEAAGDPMAAMIGLRDGRIATATAGGRLRVNTPTRQVADVSVAVPGGVVGLFEDGDRLVAVSPDGTVRAYGLSNGRMAQELSVGVPVQSAVFDPVERRLFTGHADANLRIWDMVDGTLVGSAFTTRSGWLVVDRAGRYDGSQPGIADAAWAAGTVELPVRNFGQSFYEPSLLVKLGRDPSVFATDAEPPLEAGLNLPPQVGVTVENGTAGATVRVTAQDQGGGIRDVLLFHNGRRVADAAVRNRAEGRSGQTATRTVTYLVPLVVGENRFEAVATSDRRVESLPARQTVAAPGQAAPGRLHVLTIGINTYKQADLALTYAVPDANAVAQRLAATSGGVFREVVEIPVRDADATAQGIERAFARLKQVQPNDAVVVFLAGHGYNVGKEWYFLPVDISTTAGVASIPGQGVPASRIDKWLSEVPAQRILMLIDACRSGAALDPLVDTFDRKALSNMADGLGMHVLAATQRNQDAIEFERLGHGAFTFGLLRGLDGEAVGAGAAISARALMQFAEDRVPLIASEQLERTILEVGRTRGVRAVEQLRRVVVPFPSGFSRGTDFLIAKGG